LGAFSSKTTKEFKQVTRKFCSLATAIIAIVLISASAASAQQIFKAALNSIQEVPINNSPGRGFCTITLNTAETQITVTCTYSNLTTGITAGHIHSPAPPGANAGILFPLNPTAGTTSGTFTTAPITVTAAQVALMRSKQFYVNLHTSMFPGGEIRGQVKISTTVTDYEGDGRTDITVFRQSDNTFYTLQSLNNTVASYRWGSGGGDNYLNNTADFDGDGRSDPLILEIANTVLYWSILQTRTNTTRVVPWGSFPAAPGIADNIAPADYDGDGIQDIAIFRRETGIWYILQSTTGTMRAEPFGAPLDFASIGDYDKDGKADLTVVRAESGQRVWYTRNSSNGQVVRVAFGSSTTDGVFFFANIDVDGDGAQDRMVSRAEGTQRVFYVLRSSDGAVFRLAWGLTTDTNLFGDYDGDGRTDFVARRTEGGQFNWYIYQSSTGTGRVVTFGATGDQFASEPGDFPDRSKNQDPN
jgi:hypothetical protein